MQIFKSKLKNAKVLIPIGSRPTNQRRITKWVPTLLTVVLTPVTILIWSSMAFPSVVNTLAYHEMQSFNQTQSVKQTSIQNQDLFEGQLAWYHHDYQKAFHFLMKKALSGHDLQYTGWALRSAIKTGDIRKIQMAGRLWDKQIQTSSYLNAQEKANAPRWSTSAEIKKNLKNKILPDNQRLSRLEKLFVAQKYRKDSDQLAGFSFAANDDYHLNKPIRAPLKNFLSDMESKGFSASQTLNFWLEKQILGNAKFEVKLNSSLSPDVRIADLQKWKSTLRNRFEKVDSPQALKNYYIQCANDLKKHPNYLKDLKSVSGNVFGMISNNLSWQKRLNGESGFKVKNLGFESQKVSWDQLNTYFSFVHTHLPQSHFITPDQVSVQEGESHLKSAMKKVGIHQLSWSESYGNNGKTLWKLGDLLIESNQDLQAVTGLKGPVLGLNGHANYRFYSTSSGGTYGETMPSSVNQVGIDVVLNQNDMGSLAHEWFHAFDNFNQIHKNAFELKGSEFSSLSTHIFRQDGLEEIGGSFKGYLNFKNHPWQALYQNLYYPQYKSSSLWKAQINQFYKDMQEELPLFRSQITQDIALVQAHQWSAEKSQKIWSQLDPKFQKLFKKDILNFQKRLKWISKNQNKTPWFGGKESPWVSFSQHATANSGYWSNPPELFARSFTEQIPNYMLISQNKENKEMRWSVNSDYPSHLEIQVQHQSWKNFWRQEQSFWKTKTQKLSVSQVKKNLSNRRAAQLSSNKLDIKNTL